MSPPISALMSREVHVIRMEDTVAQVEALFATHRLTWAPVVEGGSTVLGVLSASDLLRFRAEGRDLAGTPAWQLCTYKPLSAAPDTPAVEVARRMIERGIHHVVVEDANGLAGVVSALDFVRAYAQG